MLVDDEPPARRILKRLLAKHEDLDVVAEAGSLNEARDDFAAARPDIIFLDVELGDGKGFEMLAGMPAPPDVVFVTAYGGYAVRAFDVAAADFLLKPVDPERLAVTLQRLRQRRLSEPRHLAPAPPMANGTLLLNLPGMRMGVRLKTVLSLTAEGDFTRITTSDGRERLICQLLGQFEAALPSPPFHRLDRSLIVNLDNMERVEWTSRGRAQIFLGSSQRMVSLGRAAARRLRDIGTL